MVAAHPEDEFWLLFDRPFDERFRFGPNVRTLVVPPPARHPLLWWIWFEWSVPRALKRIGADVFFSPDNYCSLRASTPTVLTVHDIAYAHFPGYIPLLTRSYYRYFTPRFLRRAEKIVTVSEFTRQDMMQTLGVPGEKIEVIYNGPREAFRPLSESEKRAIRARHSGSAPYFLYVGAIHPRKNVHRLIRAFDRYKAATGAPHKLLLAGRWAWQTGEVRTAYEQAAHKDDIVFLGYLEETPLAEATGAAHALVYVSLWEGFGLPILEAMHAEVPVVYGAVSSMPEVAGPAGLGVDPESEEAIAAALQKLTEDAALCEDLVERGRVQRRRFDWEESARRVYALLSG